MKLLGKERRKENRPYDRPGILTPKQTAEAILNPDVNTTIWGDELISLARAYLASEELAEAAKVAADDLARGYDPKFARERLTNALEAYEQAKGEK